MAGKKKDTPANYDRWDTVPGTIKVTSKPSAEKKKIIDKINADLAAKKKKK